MNNKGADQTERMCRLICTFVVRIWHKTHFRMTWPILCEFKICFCDLRTINEGLAASQLLQLVIEREHGKANQKDQDSDQPGLLPSLISLCCELNGPKLHQAGFVMFLLLI